MKEDEIRELVARYQLPDGREDAVLGLAETALALGVSLPTMQRYLKIGMPALERGRVGRSWRIRLAAAWAWRQAHLEEQAERRAEIQRTISGMSRRAR
ncbi:hypothetical protein [Sinorhizobium fredii]|uniref:hypothetical protein n=1 Tax=Rhizobium fredii TaxID=380 RepID=UPI00059571BE|nr:hypothetical protein [Sinorhizobium fredii]WOS64263.1 hypothetical protein SFGR64A_07800 [Sinorhizobium fredii GR64]